MIKWDRYRDFRYGCQSTDPPCRDCADRHQACHSTCERYIEWSKVHEKAREAMITENNTREDLGSMLVRRTQRSRRARQFGRPKKE